MEIALLVAVLFCCCMRFCPEIEAVYQDVIRDGID